MPLKSHRSFWIWGTLSLVWAQLFPVLFMLAAEPLVEHLTDGAFAKEGEPSWTMALLAGPVVFVLGFVFLFWAARGLKGLVFMFRYKPDAPPTVTPSPAPAQLAPLPA